MKYTVNKEVYKSSTKERLMALTAYPSYLKLLEVSHKPYKEFLEWLLKDEFKLICEDNPFPQVKDIAKASGVDVQKIAKYLKAIYDDIFELNDKEPEKFVQEGQTLCALYFKYVTYRAYFSLGLNRVPAIGEIIDFNFIRPKIMGTRFYVESLDYFIGDKEQLISINLNANEHNLYLQLLREKAYLRGHISVMEEIELKSHNNYALKEKLINMYPHL